MATSCEAGIIAGLIGLALVVAYSILYYRGLSIVVVDVSLVIAGALIWSLMVLLRPGDGLRAQPARHRRR